MTQSVVVRAAFVALLTLYPFAVYFGLRILPASFFGLLLALLIVMRFLFVEPADRKRVLPAMLLLLAYAIAATFSGREEALLYYPVLLNAVLCVVFAASVRDGEPLLLRLVRARGMKMSQHAPAYLARLTAVWSGFFAVNALIALWSTTVSLEFWTLYNGVLAYALVGLLLLGEWLFRGYYKRKMNVVDS